MSSVVLHKISKPQSLVENITSTSKIPLPFKEWLRSNIGIISEDAQTQYDQYLTEFYIDKHASAVSTTLRDDYINLIKRLSIIFKNDADFQRFSKIDFDSSLDLKLAIPYFSRKLKDIAIYYINARNTIKTSKLQYASVGSEVGLERFLYSKLLESFSYKTPTPANGYSITSDSSLSAIRDTFHIEIEELYEDTNYYDNIDTNLDVNPLLCVLDNIIFNDCNSSDIFQLTSNSDPLQRIYLCDTDTISVSDLVTDGWSKYASSDLYYLSAGDVSASIIDVNLNMQSANNFFYWFSGESVDEIPDGVYSDVALSAINWADATAGSTIDASDIIFTSYGNLKTEGAWYMSAGDVTVNMEMTARMIDGIEFKFPYPGYGLSAVSNSWSGPMLTYDVPSEQQYFTNNDDFQENRQEISDLYWNAFTSNSTCSPISIQKLTLASDGAFASTSFKNADKLIIRGNTGDDKRHDASPDEVYWGNLELAWLYDFKKTQIPIGAETTNIYFPLTSYENAADLTFKYDQGTPIPLSSVAVNGAFAGAVAGSTIELSDVIIRKKTLCGPELEAAWLEGTPLSAFRGNDPDFCFCNDSNKFISSTDWAYSEGVAQPGLSFKVNPNQFIKFIWTGPRTAISNVRGFAGFEHDAACPYNQLNHSKSILDIDFGTTDLDAANRWRKCSCHAIYHSPIGLVGNDISVDIIPDLVLLDTNPEQEFNISNWVGSDGKPYNTSRDATWMINVQSKDKDIGWGVGVWNNDIVLETGESYVFYHTNMNRCDIALPPFIINQCYTEFITTCGKKSNLPVWRKAIMNSDGEWIGTNIHSDMILVPGGFYEYIHRESNGWTRKKIQIDGADVLGDFVTIHKLKDNYSYKTVSNTSPSIEFLIKIPLSNYPPYWGYATYISDTSTHNKQIFRNYNDNRFVGKYLITNQAIPSDIVLSDSTVIRYESFACNDCFIWKQPIEMNIKSEEYRWNKVLFDDCVRSDILTYLHSNCGDECSTDETCSCAEICSAMKTGVTATYTPSDMTFNTDMSGVPLFINYYARSPFTLNLKIKDLLRTAAPVSLSGTLISPDKPWTNLINDLNASFVSTQNVDDLKTAKDLGIFVPSQIAVGKYELHLAESAFDPTSTNPIYRLNNYFDGPFTPINIDSNWMKSANGSPIGGQHQTFYPYQSVNNYLGLYTSDTPVNPWETLTLYTPCSLSAAYTNLNVLTGHVVQWQTDIYGNQFFLINDTNMRHNPIVTSNLYMKIGNTVSRGIDTLSAVFNRYNSYTITPPFIPCSPQFISLGSNLPNKVWYSVAYGDGKYISVASSGTGPRIILSEDGLTWTTPTIVPVNPYRAVGYGGGTWVALGTTGGAYSIDGGVNWSSVSGLTGTWYSVTYNDGIFVAVGINGTTAVSTDGITWNMTIFGTTSLRSVCYGNGIFVTVGDANTIIYSTDGVNWSSSGVSTPTTVANFKSVSFGNGVFVAICNDDDPGAIYSTDGVTWYGGDINPSIEWFSIAFGGGIFVATADSTDVVGYSTNGITWEYDVMPASGRWRSVTYGDLGFVAIRQSALGYSAISECPNI